MILNTLNHVILSNYGGYKKSAIWGLIFGGFKGAKLTKISCVRFLIFFRMVGSIFLQIGGKFPKMVPFFVAEFWLFTEMVPVLFVIFGTFL